MSDPRIRPDPEGPDELELLLDRIQAGTIEDLEELDEQDLQLLRRHFGSEEDVQSLIDRLRGLGREDG
jgi:hypothetical protein